MNYFEDAIYTYKSKMCVSQYVSVGIAEWGERLVLAY